jgi:hypothetical protein
MNNIKSDIHKSLCDEMHQLYKDKNDDYGDSFAFTRSRYGRIATLTRLVDKLLRIERLILTTEPMKVQDEKIENTLIDLANYSIMEITEMRYDEILSKTAESREDGVCQCR